MSELPPRPPMPPSGPSNGNPQKPSAKPRKAGVRKEAKKPSTNQNQAPGGSGREQAEDKEKKKPGKIRKQLKPTLIMVALIAAAGVFYLSVRAAREALSPPEPSKATLPASAGRLALEVPNGWKGAEMQSVANSSARWAFGVRGARDYALFVTRYPLKGAPEDEKQLEAVRAQAERSLSQTGGPQKPKPRLEEKIDGQQAYRYAFKSERLWIDIWLLVHSADKQAALYQFSCQSKPGKAGDKMRERCAEMLNTLKFSNKTA